MEYGAACRHEVKIPRLALGVRSSVALFGLLSWGPAMDLGKVPSETHPFQHPEHSLLAEGEGAQVLAFLIWLSQLALKDCNPESKPFRALSWRAAWMTSSSPSRR